MGLNLELNDFQTPLEEDEKEGLLISTITNRADLDEFEQLGVVETMKWLVGKRFLYQDVLNIIFIKTLHKKMFSTVWKWAGEFRLTNKNIGIDKSIILEELKKLFDDCIYWIENKTFSEDEIALRLSHRLVWIHPFANGNGRLSRLHADVLINNCFGKPNFTWGAKNLIKEGEARTKYLEAIREADLLNYKPLIRFARM
ncbi:MAG: mobile mystery protein B [Ignavibacteriales bacterium]|nr:mobile mystery protein B [Ignavibacteriales bacterium]